MASGLGVRGTVGRCYGFFADFKQCQTEARADFKESVINGDETAKYKECLGAHQDYFECLHQRKMNARINRVLEEEKKQADGGGSSH